MNNTTKKNYTGAMGILSFLFFMFGFVTSLKGILIPYLKESLELTGFQAQLINFAFFIAFGILAIPSGAIIKKIGYKSGVVGGISILGLGLLLFYPATASAGGTALFFFMVATFIMATGVVLLQVAANPFVTRLGDPKGASARLTFTGAINSLGTVAAPIFGTIILFGASDSIGTDAMKMPFLYLAITAFVVAGIVYFLKLPEIDEENTENESGVIEEAEKEKGKTSVWQLTSVVLGGLAIVFYVGAEEGIATNFIEYYKEVGANVTWGWLAGFAKFMKPTFNATNANEVAGLLISLYWGGAMIGRFIGAAILSKFDEAKVLVLFSLIAAALVLASSFSESNTAIYLVMLVGFFNSIMWPSIFGIALGGLSKFTKSASGILCTGAVGGALIPLAMGWVSDVWSYQIAMGFLAISYLYIAFFGAFGSKFDK